MTSPTGSDADYDANRGAAVLLPGDPLDATLEFFIQLGLRVDAIYPADAPATVILSGHGLTIRLESDYHGPPGVICVTRPWDDRPADANRLDRGDELVAPNGTRIRWIDADPTPSIPPLHPSLVINRLTDDDDWNVGRAGMLYRDLIPDRLGGRFIASHIKILSGGPVPDYVHFHRVRFQLIYCRRGWVKVVYEDQGAPFMLKEGDAVLQPPTIRHRVLESSAGLEVIEIGCPALHETIADHRICLPNDRVDVERRFHGQRFVRHIADEATWQGWRHPQFEVRDVGIAKATEGLATVGVARPLPGSDPPRVKATSHDAEFCWYFVLRGSVTLRVGTGAASVAHALSVDDSWTVPAGVESSLDQVSSDLELLEVALPARFNTREGHDQPEATRIGID